MAILTKRGKLNGGSFKSKGNGEYLITSYEHPTVEAELVSYNTTNSNRNNLLYSQLYFL